MAGGSYQVVVQVRTDPAAAEEARNGVDFQIGNSPATGVTITPSASTPHPQGTSVTFTAAGKDLADTSTSSGRSSIPPGRSSNPQHGSHLDDAGCNAGRKLRCGGPGAYQYGGNGGRARDAAVRDPVERAFSKGPVQTPRRAPSIRRPPGSCHVWSHHDGELPWVPQDNGLPILRVKASECDTPEKAAMCATHVRPISRGGTLSSATSQLDRIARPLLHQRHAPRSPVAPLRRACRDEQLWINNAISALNTATRQAAESVGVEYVDTFEAFDGGEACAGAPHDLPQRSGRRPFPPDGRASAAPLWRNSSISRST